MATLVTDMISRVPRTYIPCTATVKPQSRRRSTQPEGKHGRETSSRWEELPSSLLRVSCYAPYSVQYQSEAPTTDRFVEVVGLCFKLWLRARSCSGRPFPQSLVELSLPCRKEHSGRPCPRNSKRPVGMNSSYDRYFYREGGTATLKGIEYTVKTKWSRFRQTDPNTV
jgi:hypothetical protein